MSNLPGTLIGCLMMMFVHAEGIQFFMDNTPDSVYCGHLTCWADKIFTDSNIHSIVGLAVYDVTQSNTSVKLASILLFDQNDCVDPNTTHVINVTSNISSYHAEIVLGFRDNGYCLNGSFLCELDYVNADSQPQIIRETVSPGKNEKCPLSFKQFANQAIQIKTHSDILETENVELRDKLRNALDQLSKLQEIVNSTSDRKKTCLKGAPHSNTRETFLLWDKLPALCDTETDGGGWIIIQRRTKGDVDFYRGWNDYKNGFGNPDTDFWIGNGIIHNFTSQGQTELRFDVEYQGKQYYAHYSDFKVGNESSSYRLSMGDYDGNVGYDSFRYNNGSEFSTYDRDNINKCVSSCRGAWWHLFCTHINLNGLWGAHDDATGLYFSHVVYPGSVDVSEMKVRHV